MDSAGEVALQEPVPPTVPQTVARAAGRAAGDEPVRYLLNGEWFDPVRFGDERDDQGRRREAWPCRWCEAAVGRRHRGSCRRAPGIHRAPVECLECGVAAGEVHLLDCTVEQCPRCGGQFVSCPCVLG